MKGEGRIWAIGAAGTDTEFWDGDAWVTDNTVNTGLPSGTWVGSAQNLFGDNIPCLFSGADAAITGYTYNGTSWASNTSCRSGIWGQFQGIPGGNIQAIAMFDTFGTEAGNIYGLLMFKSNFGTGTKQVQQFKWTGSTWTCLLYTSPSPRD